MNVCTLLDDNLVQSQLHFCSLYNPLFHCVLCDQTKHLHLFGLPDAVSSILSLQVHLGVPVGVIEDDNVSGGKVNAQSSSPCGQHEDEFVTARTIEQVDALLQEG